MFVLKSVILVITASEQFQSLTNDNKTNGENIATNYDALQVRQDVFTYCKIVRILKKQKTSQETHINNSFFLSLFLTSCSDKIELVFFLSSHILSFVSLDQVDLDISDIDVCWKAAVHG